MSFQRYQICKVAVLTVQSLYPKLSTCQTNVSHKLNRTIKHLIKKNPAEGMNVRLFHFLCVVLVAASATSPTGCVCVCVCVCVCLMSTKLGNEAA
jgi:hypothetical protein